jgi:hypothetical protein
MSKTIIALSPTGMLSSGFPIESFRKGLNFNPDFVGVDSGSTDVGPYFLGSGESAGSRASMKKYLTILIKETRNRGIPLLIGSAGTAGGDPHVKWMRDIIAEIASDENIKFRMAVIHSEQNKKFLKNKLSNGKIKPLNPWGFKKDYEISEQSIDRATRIVGVMGAEPFIEALKEDVDIVLAGRSTDTAIFASIPLMEGIPPEVAWHMAKILECGAAAVQNRPEDECLLAKITDKYFEVFPPNELLRCTPQSVRSHMLYENPSPFHLYEPSGMLDTSKSTYQAIDERTVRVSGSKWVPGESYTIKLEGVELIGYKAVFVAGIRDPILISEIDNFLSRARGTWKKKIMMAYPELKDEDYNVIIKIYGKDAVMGPMETNFSVNPKEVGVLGIVIAPSEIYAQGIAYIVYRVLLHQHYGHFSGLLTGLAVPLSPEILNGGPAYKFTFNHLVLPDSPLEMFKTEIEEF